jgi:hypothetical protein
MAIIEDALSNLKSIKKMIPQYGKEAILENKFTIIERLKNWQWAKGIGSDGSVVGTYADSTQGYADADNISTPKTAGSPYNFYWSGDAAENLYLKSVNKTKGTFDISTIAAKKRLFDEEFGEMFDLTDEQNDWINENIVEPYMAKKIEERLFDF